MEEALSVWAEDFLRVGSGQVSGSELRFKKDESPLSISFKPKFKWRE